MITTALSLRIVHQVRSRLAHILRPLQFYALVVLHLEHRAIIALDCIPLSKREPLTVAGAEVITSKVYKQACRCFVLLAVSSLELREFIECCHLSALPARVIDCPSKRVTHQLEPLFYLCVVSAKPAFITRAAFLLSLIHI